MRSALLVFSLIVLFGTVASGAEINLQPTVEPTPHETSAKALRLIEIFDLLRVDPRQLVEMGAELGRLPALRQAAGEKEAEALLKAHEALVTKVNLLLKEEPVPEETEKAIEEAFIAAGQALTDLHRAEQDAVDSIFARFGDMQRMIIQFEGGEMDERERMAILAQAQGMARQAEALATQMLAPGLHDIWTMRNQQIYLRQRAVVADDILGALGGRGLLGDGPAMYERQQLMLFRFFDDIRAMDYDMFNAMLERGAITQQLFRMLGVQTGISTDDLPRIPEQEIRDLLIEPYCITMVVERAKSFTEEFGDMPGPMGPRGAPMGPGPG